MDGFNWATSEVYYALILIHSSFVRKWFPWRRYLPWFNISLMDGWTPYGRLVMGQYPKFITPRYWFFIRYKMKPLKKTPYGQLVMGQHLKFITQHIDTDFLFARKWNPWRSYLPGFDISQVDGLTPNGRRLVMYVTKYEVYTVLCLFVFFF